MQFICNSAFSELSRREMTPGMNVILVKLVTKVEAGIEHRQQRKRVWTTILPVKQRFKFAVSEYNANGVASSSAAIAASGNE